MNYQQLSELIFSKRSYLCIGLDTDTQRLPATVLTEKDPVFVFNKDIIDATHSFVASYKINTAFYEAQGVKGWESLQKTLDYIPKGIFTIADAKRADIGNTSAQYAKAFFQTLPFDAITVAPYMGHDSIQPFLEIPDKWTILLALTSNPGSHDFQKLSITEQELLFERVLRISSGWADETKMMYVVGATQAASLDKIRAIIPQHFLLVPGVGAQGGNLEEVSKAALNPKGGLLVNVSRDIIYASSNSDYAQAAALKAQAYQKEMEKFLLTL